MKKQAILLVICLLNAAGSIAAGASLLYSDQPALKWEYRFRFPVLKERWFNQNTYYTRQVNY